MEKGRAGLSAMAAVAGKKQGRPVSLVFIHQGHRACPREIWLRMVPVFMMARRRLQVGSISRRRNQCQGVPAHNPLYGRRVPLIPMP